MSVPTLSPPDAIAAAAVDLARAAAERVAPGLVGEHLGASSEGDRLVVHGFASLDPAYVGWQWAVTLARASRARTATVDDVVLLPGPQAVLAPVWVPYSERLLPGDLGVGDLLPTAAEDLRLVPGRLDTDDPDEVRVAAELSGGRERVLSVEGREQAVDRWYAGDRGPDAAIAKAAPRHCGSCGFYVSLSGALRQAFGACANGLAPDDGMVVSVDHGCGAHSQALVVEEGPAVAAPAAATDAPVAAE